MKRITAFLLTFGMTCGLSARVTPGPLLSDGMVLQQKTQVTLRGWAKPSATVTITPSWNRRPVSCTTGSDGRWVARLQTPAGSFHPYTLTLSDGQPLIIHDVLVGEVWLASGQSNMEMPLHGFASCPVEGSNEEIAASLRYRDKLHFVTVPRSPQRHPVDTVTVKWENCMPATARNFCAVGYFFGTFLIDALQCPVGVINSSWGATRVEGWTPEEILRTYPDENLNDSLFSEVGKVSPYQVESSLPLVMYNGMIHPLEGYTIRGFLWYQGEANVAKPNNYADRFVRMVKVWRQQWGQGELPFYYVEIAPYDYFWVDDKDKSALLREQQTMAQHMLPRMGMVCTNDLVHDYEYWQIHPCLKKDVARRLFFWAMSDTYGIKGIDAESPEYQSMEIKDDKAILSFTHTEEGFNRNVGIEGFEICGADKVFHKASAGTSGSKVSVYSKDVPQPVAVRYAFHSFLLGNLKNAAGLPLIPFRTDRP